MNGIVGRVCSHFTITSVTKFELFNITLDFCHVISGFVVSLTQG